MTDIRGSGETRRERRGVPLVLVPLLTCLFVLPTALDWTDARISVAVAALLALHRRASGLVVASTGILVGYSVLGPLWSPTEWSVGLWICVGLLAVIEVVVLHRILLRMVSGATDRLPSRRVMEFVISASAMTIATGFGEFAVVSTLSTHAHASPMTSIVGIGFGACLAAIVATRRGVDWLTSGRLPGSELLAPLLVVLVTLVAVHATRQSWKQHDNDRLALLERSARSSLTDVLDQKFDIVRLKAESLGTAVAQDVAEFRLRMAPFVETEDIVAGSALAVRDDSTGTVTVFDFVGDEGIDKVLGVRASDEGLSLVDEAGRRYVVQSVDLERMPDRPQFVLLVAHSLGEAVKLVSYDIFDRPGEVTWRITPVIDSSTSENGAKGSVTLSGSAVDFGRQQLLVSLVPTSQFGTSFATQVFVLGSEVVLGVVLTAVLVLGANAQFKMSQERRRREILLEAALDATPGVSVVFDREFRILAANRPVRDQYGARIPGMAVVELFGVKGDSGRRRLVEETLKKAIDGQQAHAEIAEDAGLDGEMNGSALGAGMRIIELSAYPVSGPSGDPVGFLHSVDATERRSLAMRSAQSERMESLGVLAGGLAHDFNNLLFVTLGNLQLMAMNETVAQDDKLSKFVSRSMSAVERGAEITKSLLSVARSEPLEESPVAVADLVKGILPLVRQALGAGRRVEVDIADPELELMVDAGRLSSCLLNLTFNSRDAMGPNGTLRISARLNQDSDMIDLSVADDGAGMPPDVVARAFEPFFTTKSPGSGTGLGLATVYAFAKQSGGSAYLDSRIGAGTTVTLSLPRHTGSTAVATTKTTRRAGRRVVVADDEQSLAEMVSAWLIDMGIDARFATSPKAALELIETFEPDVLVSDANFGEELDGIELARLGTAIVPDMAVVFMTGYSTSMRELQELGERTLAKPFSREDLYAALSPLIAVVDEVASDRTST